MRKLGSLLAMLVAWGATASGVMAQERGSVAGQVVITGTQEPLRGALVTIAVVGSSAVTDEQGRFRLASVPFGRHTLRVSYIGYKQATREVTVGTTTESVTIALTSDPLRMDELVVVGYGEVRRSTVAGAVASMKPETVKETPVTAIQQVMQGRMPGVQIAQNSGTPGAAINVRIRGSSSISGGNEPLYVIDGVPLNQGDFSSLMMGFGGQDIDAVSDLSPNEIESIEILKDASAAAIYGSRASNGVVLIKTKRGTAARPEINFGAYYGTQSDWRRIDLLNAAQYTTIYNEGCQARFSAPCVGYTDDGVEDRVEAVRGADTDWLDQVLRKAPISSMEGSVRGGNERVRYYVSGSSVVQDGTVKSMGYSRMNGRVNLDYVPADRLSLGTNVALTRSLYHRARSDNTIYGAFPNALANPPITPVFTDDGDYFETLYANPVGMNNEAEAEERGTRILGNVFGTYTLIDGVTARASVGLDNLVMRSRSYDSPRFGPFASNGGAAEAGNAFVNKLTYEATLNLNRQLGSQNVQTADDAVVSRHEVSGVVGASYEDNTEEGQQVQGTQFPTEYFKYITSAATIADGSSTRADWGLTSYFGRLSYTFNDRVTTTFNVRRDGSSRFGAANRFGTFPSVSVVWRVGEEPFLQSQELVGNLAVRASFGVTGNQQSLGNFASRGLFGGGFNYDDQPGIAPSQLANPDLRWEKTKQLNLGTDFSVLSDRVTLTLDYYEKNTTDLLVARPVPRTTGFSTIWDNVGSMENKGFEIAAGADLIRGGSRGLNWTSNLSFSRNRNKVVELYNHQPITGTNRVEEEYPLGFFYGWVTDGIFKTIEEVQAHATQVTHSDPRRATAPGDIRFKDINGRDANGNLTGQPDGVINADDRTKIGNPWPDFEGGLTNTLSFRGVDLTAFVQFSFGNDVFNGNRIYMDQFGSFGDNHTTRAMDRWTPENPDAIEPRAIWGDPNQNTRVSDRFVEDGSYVRLKNIVVGYTLPTAMADRFGFRTARIYVQGQNILTSTNYSGFDPEVNSTGQTAITRGFDFYTLPQARVFTLGVNVGF